MKLLEAHGITLLPEDNASETPLINLMRSGGQRLKLTEAGKLALGKTAPKQSPIVVTRPVGATRPLGSAQKVIMLDKSGVRSRVVTSSPSMQGLPGKGTAPVTRRITVSPAQLDKLRELQKSGRGFL